MPKIESEEQSLQCSAHGCPMRWSVDGGNVTKLCSYHAWEPASKWPKITEDLRQYGAWELQKKREVDTSVYKYDPKGWAKRLKDRHEAGEKLSKFQIECYQAALKLDMVQSD